MPQPVIINFWALLVVAIINMLIGFFWYGPLFGKTWMREMGITGEMMQQTPRSAIMRSTVISFVGALIMYYVLSHSVIYAGANTVAGGAIIGLWTWLGFVAVPYLNSIVYERKSFVFYVMTTGYYLVVLAIGGAILSVWR